MDDEFGGAEESGEALQTFFPSVLEFVEFWVLPHYRRSPATNRWSANWWEYAEVVSRMEAVWRAWEHYRLEGMTGMSVFYLNVFDPMMREITGPEGPFWNGADLGGGGVPEMWEVAAAPAEVVAALHR